MIDELGTLNKSLDLFTSREESDNSPARSADASPEQTPGTHADGPAAAGWKSGDERHPGTSAPRIGEYLVLAPLGSDDQAQVFLVLHPELGREYVLKLYSSSTTDNPAAGERLRREGRLIIACRHPNLLEIMDVDVHEGHPFIVTERVQGLSLTDYTRERRPGAREAAGLVVELTWAVEYIHARGIIHQNLTRSNVLIDETGRPKLMDFGLARLRAAWSVDPHGLGGTATSEMGRRDVTCHDEPIGPETDVFGLGTILEHVLMGQPAQSRPSGSPLPPCENENEAPAPRPDRLRVPRSLQRICEKAMAPDQNRRYQTAAELEWALRRYRSRRWFAWSVVVIGTVMAAAAFFARS